MGQRNQGGDRIGSGPGKVIAITTGDPAGIGPEIISAALASKHLSQDFEYRIIGRSDGFTPGNPTPESARAALDALEEASWLTVTRQVAAVVTGPIHKHRMQEVGFAFPGMTEFFAARCGVQDFAMCLTGGALTVGLVTCHIPLRDVAEAVTTEEIVRVGNLLAEFVRRRAKEHGRIAVAGLNPHAGESGAFGREEMEIIAPAIEELNRMEPQASGKVPSKPRSPLFSGPYSPDTVFNRAAAGEFDAVLCMYHDQGLIPLKLHAFDKGVNVTLGLPVIRTSPDHGTAFEIAGKGIARPNSMIAAIALATELASTAPQ